MAKKSDLTRRLKAMEARLDQLEASAAPPALPGPDSAVVEFAARIELPPESGAPGPAAVAVRVPTSAVLARDWTAAAAPLAALGNPLRLRLLRAMLDGIEDSAGLTAALGGTTGRLHHHLRDLAAAGWIHPAGRGRHRLAEDRVAPLLVVLAAVTEGT